MFQGTYILRRPLTVMILDQSHVETIHRVAGLTEHAIICTRIHAELPSLAAAVTATAY